MFSSYIFKNTFTEEYRFLSFHSIISRILTLLSNTDSKSVSTCVNCTVDFVAL